MVDNTVQTPDVGVAFDRREEFDLRALVGILWRGKGWIALCGAIVMACTISYGILLATPMFPARATIVLNAQEQQVISDIDSIFAAGGTDTVTVNTEIEVLRSRGLIGPLVDDLNLVEDPEFNGLEDRLGPMGLVRATFTGWERTTPSPEELRNRVIDAVTARLVISNIRQSLAFNLSIETTNRTKSAAIVNRLAELYVEQQIQQELDEATRAIEFLSRRTAELQGNVEMLEQDLASRVESSTVINADTLQAQNLRLRDLRERIDEISRRVALDEGLSASLSAAPDVETLVMLAEANGDGRFSGMIQRYRAGRLSDAAAELAFDSLIEDLDADVERQRAQADALMASAASLSEQVAAQSEELIALQQLEREVEVARLLYQTFLTRLQEASVQQGLESANSRILSEAVPRQASSPRMTMLAVLGAMLGGFIGTALVLFREWRFAGFRTTDELRGRTGAKILGTLPALGVRERRDVLAYLRDKKKSVFAEAVRNLRTSVLMMNPDREPQVILVTSSIPGEGKTTASLALSRHFSTLEGKRVLLMEADVRRQTLRAYVDEGRSSEVHLIDAILGRVDIATANMMDPDLGVEVLMGSGGEINAVDLFESRRFEELLNRLRETYDHIIIDSAPVLAVPDARVLARYADHIVFAVRWSFTSQTQVRQGLDMLASVGNTAVGLVLTQVDTRKMRSYGYSGQYGYDGYASGYYAKD